MIEQNKKQKPSSLKIVRENRLHIYNLPTYIGDK